MVSNWAMWKWKWHVRRICVNKGEFQPPRAVSVQTTCLNSDTCLILYGYRMPKNFILSWVEEQKVEGVWQDGAPPPFSGFIVGQRLQSVILYLVHLYFLCWRYIHKCNAGATAQVDMFRIKAQNNNGYWNHNIWKYCVCDLDLNMCHIIRDAHVEL